MPPEPCVGWLWVRGSSGSVLGGCYHARLPKAFALKECHRKCPRVQLHCIHALLMWEKESTYYPALVKIFFCQKNGGHRGKISVVCIYIYIYTCIYIYIRVEKSFVVFIGPLYPPPAWKVFLSGQKSSPKDFLSVVVVYVFFFSVNCFQNY